MRSTLVLLVIVICLQPSSRAAELARERIVYTTLRPANWDLFLFSDRTQAPLLVNDNFALDYDATFSPDGRWIVFCSERSGNPDLYTIDVEHSGSPRPLTHGKFMEAAPAFTPDGKSLLFVSDRDGNADIFMMPFRPNDPAAADQAANLTRHASGDFRPAVSPDGQRLAFSSDRDSWSETINSRQLPYRAEIYVMDLDGRNLRRLTTANAMSGSPAWSRDGRKLYFYSDREGGSFRIWAMDADGTHQRALTPKEQPALSPAVMPDGRVAFAAQHPDGFQIMSVAADGSGLRVESGAQKDCHGPAFDRTGRLICTGQGSVEGMLQVSNGRPFFARGAHDEVQLPDRVLDVQAVHRQFCSISPDGREFLRTQLLTASESTDTHLVASQLDGSKDREIFRPPKSADVWATSWARRADLIAFALGPQFAPDDAIVDIWTVRGDGSKATNLTAGKFRNNSFPDLTADGSEIVFRSTRDGNKEIYLMKSDGTNLRRITNDPANDTMPSISPAGGMIAFSSDRDQGRFQLYLQALKNGKPEGAPRVFAAGLSPNMHSRFSPDGKWIVFASARAWLNDEAPLSNGNPQPYGELFIAPVDGQSEPIRLTHNKWEDSIPSWGPWPAN